MWCDGARDKFTCYLHDGRLKWCNPITKVLPHNPICSEFQAEFAPGGGRTSGLKDGRHFWYEIHMKGAEDLRDDRCCRKISP